jgi:hypothetical protein
MTVESLWWRELKFGDVKWFAYATLSGGYLGTVEKPGVRQTWIQILPFLPNSLTWDKLFQCVWICFFICRGFVAWLHKTEWMSVCGNVSKLKSVSCNYVTFGEEKAPCCGPQILSQTRLVLTRMYWILQVCVFSTVKYVCFVHYFENMTEVKHGAQHWDSKRHSVSTRAHLSGLQSCV